MARYQHTILFSTGIRIIFNVDTSSGLLLNCVKVLQVDSSQGRDAKEMNTPQKREVWTTVTRVMLSMFCNDPFISNAEIRPALTMKEKSDIARLRLLEGI